MLFLLFCLAVTLCVAKNYLNYLRAKPDFTGKIILITGGSSGLGEELTKQLVTKYHALKIIIAARNLKEMERVR